MWQTLLFTQLTFWVFFSIVFALYAVLPHRAQNRMLLVASYVFYGAWDWRFLSLILISTLIDYVVGLRMQAATQDTVRKRLLMVSLAANLGMLGVFKYAGFFVDSFIAMLAQVGYAADPFTVSIILPVGISFFTFQTLSYTIDIYRRTLKPTSDFLDFALFVAFFPQLVAGPIERASNLLPNIAKPRQLSWDNIARGAVLCLQGLLKKVVIADGIAPSVNAIYANPNASGLDIILATWLFAIQIYCDFSGYTDIARGVAKALGFRLMRNFAQPYFATNPQEFWRRWHISLSTWLRDYLYISLGGNRDGPRKTYRNLMLTMTLGGLWHGAAWNFVLWGIYQGTLLALHRMIFGTAPAVRRTGLGAALLRLLGIALFFQVVCYGWLLFRAQSLEQIITYTHRLMSPFAEGYFVSQLPSLPIASVIGIIALLFWDSAIELSGNVRFYLVLPKPVRALLYAGMVYLLAMGATTAPAAFIYFQF